MKLEQVLVKDLVTPAENIRKHPDKQIEEIIRSFQMFGQIRAVVIDENNYIWAGNGFVEAMRKLGTESVSAYRMVGLTDSQKKKLMLADNKTYALGADNLSVLDEVMRSLEDFDIPGYDEGVLADLYADDESFSPVATAPEPVISYGSIEPAVVQNINHRAETPVQAVPVTPVAPPAPAEPNVTVQEHEPEKTSVRKFVICPKCGEKIWL